MGVRTAFTCGTRQASCMPSGITRNAKYSGLKICRLAGVPVRDGSGKKQQSVDGGHRRGCAVAASDPGQTTEPQSLDQVSGSRLSHTAWIIAPAFLGFAYVLAVLPELGPPSGVAVTGLWKFGLVATHALIFVLVPVAMRIFHEALPGLKIDRGGVFASQLGFGFVMVAIASEIGWHVTQAWYYTNDYTMLNFMFYFFLLSSFALLADALRKEDTWATQALDAVFGLLLLGTSILYPIGAQVGEDSYKIPIYVTLTLVTAVLTWRGWKLLEDKRVFLYPVLAVGVNLFFIFLLDRYGTAEWSNALFHIAHDLLGTEAGVALFVYLVFETIPDKTTLSK